MGQKLRTDVIVCSALMTINHEERQLIFKWCQDDANSRVNEGHRSLISKESLILPALVSFCLLRDPPHTHLCDSADAAAAAVGASPTQGEREKNLNVLHKPGVNLQIRKIESQSVSQSVRER